MEKKGKKVKVKAPKKKKATPLKKKQKRTVAAPLAKVVKSLRDMMSQELSCNRATSCSGSELL